jgi:hypothetical protein
LIVPINTSRIAVRSVALPEPINLTGYFSTTRHLCHRDTLFFSSDRPGTRKWTYGCRKARRMWENPLTQEIRPTLRSLNCRPTRHNFARLFFDRREGFGYRLVLWGRLPGRMLGTAIELPQAINIPGNHTYGPRPDDAVHASIIQASALGEIS